MEWYKEGYEVPDEYYGDDMEKEYTEEEIDDTYPGTENEAWMERFWDED